MYAVAPPHIIPAQTQHAYFLKMDVSLEIVLKETESDEDSSDDKQS